MMEMIQRPQELPSVTLVVRSPLVDHAIYMTVSYCPAGSWGGDYDRPVEVFLNSKDLKNYQWVSCVTRLLSALLRQKGPFPWYALEELINTFDPSKGGYYVEGTGEWVNGLVSHLGRVLWRYCEDSGVPHAE